MKKIALVSTLLFAACGGGGDNPDAPPHFDSPPQPDAPPACTAITLGAQIFDGADDVSMGFEAPINEDLGDPTPGTMLFQFVDRDGTGDLSGTTDLVQAPNDNFMTCTHCFIAFTTNPVAAEPTVRGMMGTLDNVVLSEATFDPNTGSTTPVPDGSCLSLAPSVALNQDDVPDTWTCDPTAFANQDAICDCVCGAPDPDCDGAQTTTN